MKISDYLNNLVENYSWAIFVHVINQKFCKKYMPTMKDYPAVVVTCSYKDYFDVSFGYSGTDKKKAKKDYSGIVESPIWRSPLKDKLDDLATNKEKVECNFPVGNCAEPRAVNNMLERYENQNIKLSDFNFSYATRPRTGEIIPYCDNCIYVFEQLYNK